MALICGVCFRKSSLKLLSISEAKLRLIRDYHYDLYDTNNLPKKLCKSCSSTLSDIEKKGPASSRKLPDTDYDSNIFTPRATRSNESSYVPAPSAGLAGWRPSHTSHTRKLSETNQVVPEKLQCWKMSNFVVTAKESSTVESAISATRHPRTPT